MNEKIVKPNIVAFLDILGYKNLLESKYKNNENKLLKIVNSVIIQSYETVSNLSNKTVDTLENKIHINTFSDNIVLNIEINEDFSVYDLLNYFRIISEISRIFTTNHNIFIRGGIELGNYYRDENFVFGSGLVKAYEAESKAIYPRITVSKSVLELFEKYNIKNYLDKQGNNLLKNINKLNALINKNINLKQVDNDELNSLKNDIISKIADYELTICFSHYESLGESSIKVIESLKKSQFIISRIEVNNINEFTIGQLNHIMPLLKKMLIEFKLIQKDSIEKFKSKYLIIDNQGIVYLNYLAYHVTVLYSFKKYPSFPYFNKLSNGSFIYSRAINDEGIIMFAQIGDDFLVNRDDNIKKIITHKNNICSNIKEYRNIVNCEKILEKYIWLKDYHNEFCKTLFESNFIDFSLFSLIEISN